MENGFLHWCRETVGYIRFKPDREAVRQELMHHLADKQRVLEAAGVPREAAMERAVAEMGEAEAVGRALDRVHQPWLGWLWMVSRATVFIGLLAVLVAFMSGFQSWKRELVLLPDRVDYETETPLFLSEPDERCTRVAVGGGVETAESCGYTMTVPYAALWQEMVDGTACYTFSAVLEVENSAPWDGPANGIYSYLHMKDNTGRLFRDTLNAEKGDVNRMRSVGVLEQNRFRSRYRIWAVLGETPVEWMELEYPSTAGWSLRIEWEETS